MRLSVVVPVYNVAQHLRQCLVSLAEQMDVPDYEVLLVNDASTDNSRGICSEWCADHAHFRLICHERNAGLSAARNTGLAEATGEYITFVDSDDFLAPRTLQQALDAMGDADVLEYPVRVGHLSAHAHTDALGEGTCSFQQWFECGGWQHSYAWNKVYRRSLWQGVTFPLGRNYEDLLTIPYILLRARAIACTSQGMYYYCCRPGSITATPSLRNLRDYAEALEQLLRLPEAAGNHRLYLRALNAERSYEAQHRAEKGTNGDTIVQRRCLPWQFVVAKGLTWHDRLKVIYYKLTRRA